MKVSDLLKTFPAYQHLVDNRLLILPELFTLELEPPTETSVLVRITDPDRTMGTLLHTWHSQIKAEFHDITSESISALRAGYKVPTEKALRPISKYLSQHREHFVVIHCGAGISRSAGVAKAFAEYTGRPNLSEYISTCKLFYPNEEVVKILRNIWQLGVS